MNPKTLSRPFSAVRGASCLALTLVLTSLFHAKALAQPPQPDFQTWGLETLERIETDFSIPESSVQMRLKDADGRYSDHWNSPLTQPRDKGGLLGQESVARAFLRASKEYNAKNRL